MSLTDTPSRRAVQRVWWAAVSLSAVAALLIGWGLVDLLRAHVLAASIGRSEEEMVGPVLLVVVSAVFGAERLWPAVPRPTSAVAHLVDGVYLILCALVAPFVVLLNTGFALVVQHGLPFLLLGRLTVAPKIAMTLVVLAGIDAMNWAAHMANHRSPVLWRFHALHHSQEEMSVLTTFRTHPLSHFSYLPAVLPALVLAANGPVPAAALVGYGCLVALPHANLRWRYGPLERWLVSPAYHRLHHASAPVGGRSVVNFGFVLVVWDRLAGTSVFPGGEPLLPTGLVGRPVPVEQTAGARPRLVAAQLMQPLRRSSGLEG